MFFFRVEFGSGSESGSFLEYRIRTVFILYPDPSVSMNVQSVTVIEKSLVCEVVRTKRLSHDDRQGKRGERAGIRTEAYSHIHQGRGEKVGIRTEAYSHIQQGRVEKAGIRTEAHPHIQQRGERVL